MSSLNNLSFDLKPLKPLKAELKEDIHAEKSGQKLNFQPRAFFQFFTWLNRVQGKGQAQLLDIDILSFAGDHGINAEFTTPRFRSGEFLMEAMRQETMPELWKGNLSLQHYWVDLGVDYAFESNISYWLNHNNKLINSKIKARTESFSSYPAMTDDELAEAFYSGRKLVDRAHYQEKDLLVLHSLGEGQIFSVYALAWALSISDAKAWTQYLPAWLSPDVEQEIQRLAKKHPISHNPFTNLCFYGGFETVALCGAIIRAAEKGIPFLLADPMAIIAWQYAAKIVPGVEQYGYAVGSFAEHLSKDYGSFKENMTYTASGREWYPFIWKMQQELRQYNAQ